MTAKVNKGGVRPVSKTGKAYQNRLREYTAKMSSVGYSDGYFSKESGGFYVVVKSRYPHKREEIEAARILADKGYKVYLQDEVGSFSKGDGILFTFSYEQSTPDKANGAHGVKKCLGHAKEKGVQIALIYDKYERFNEKIVNDGIAEYEKHVKNYRFARIIVIESNGRIVNYRHNKK